MWHIPRKRSERRPLASAGPARATLLDDRLRVMAQPIVSLRTGELVAEELMPVIVRPPAVRRLGVVDLDAWLVQRAAYAAGAQERHMHVGLSARSLTSEGFAARARRAIERAAVDAGLVTLEIDEATAAS